MKTLKKQSLKRIKLKIKIEDFIKKELWQYLIVIAFLFICGWLFDKYILAVNLAIAHFYMRPKFNKQFHCRNNNRKIAITLCLVLTCTLIFFSVAIVLPLHISLLSSLPVTYFICWFGYVVQDRIDLLNKLKPNIYQLSEKEFIDFCNRKELNNEEREIAVLIFRKRLKGESLYKAAGYCKRQVIRIKQKIIKKFNI